MPPVEYQNTKPATPPRGTKVKTTPSADGEIQHVILENVGPSIIVSPAPYHASPFGGFRTANDFLVQDNVHLYPGASTPYETDRYGFEADAGGKGSIAHLPLQSAMRLTVSDNTNGAKARLRTHDDVRYQAGAATHIKMTGYGDLGNLYSVIRSSVSGAAVDTRTAMSSWNVDNTSLDVTKGNIFEFMYQWLGVGDVKFFVNGVLKHITVHAGQLSEPYMKTANLPLSIEIVNDAGTQYIRFGQFDDNDGIFYEIQRTAGLGTFTYICSSARILNGLNYPTVAFGFSRAITGVGTTLLPLFSLRIKSLFNGISSRVFMLPTFLSCFSETKAGAFSLVLNPTLTNSNFTATSPSPGVEVDTAASAMANGTEVLRVSLATDAFQLIPLTDIFTVSGTKIRKKAFTGVSDILTVGVVREGPADFDPRATVNWREVR